MSQPTPPVAKRIPFEITTHGHTRVDDYYWLRDRDDPAVIDYLNAENDYMRAVMAHTEALQQTLYDEMVARIQETDEDVPVRIGDYFYYSRTVEGQQYAIECRKRGSLDADEEVLLDLNDMVAAHSWAYAKLGVFEPSPDHRLLAYSLDTDGNENFITYFKDLQSGDLLPDQIPGTKYDGEWGNDNRTFFYVTQDHAKRDHALYRHVLGTPVVDDELLYQEDDELFWVGLDKSRDLRYLFLGSDSITTSEVRYLDADQPLGDLQLVQSRMQGMEYSVDHREGVFYIITNRDAVNFKVCTAPVATPGVDHWTDWVAHDPDVLIQGIDLFAGHAVLYKREHGLRTLRITDLASGTHRELDFPEASYVYYPHDNLEHDTHLLRFTYTSFTTPDTVYDVDLNTLDWTLKKRKPVLGGFAPADYHSERLLATAPDGAQVPISLVYRVGTPRDGSAPCLLYGYGAYGYSLDPTFDSRRISLLDRGFIYAIAHVRGGEELGRPWYEDGKFLHKRNTFTDFIACGEHLIAAGYTSRETLAIQGGSAGGLLAGAVLNLAPELCHAAICNVPFVDVVTTMLDESIPLTVTEFEEWGNPQDKDYYAYMLSYSPYDNLAAREYPHVLVTAGLNDPRVQYWEPAKWIARARTLFQGDNRLIMKMNMGAGHHGASGRYDALKETAFEYAFLIDTLLPEPRSS